MNILAPIVLFVYNRPWHTEQTVNALLENKLSSESDIIIYSDAAKNDDALNAVNEVRNYIKTINGFKKISIIEREKNFGLANSIIDGVTNVVNKYGKIIVLEDDLLTSPYFLTYMNDALELYANDDRVISVHGYVYPIKQELPEAFFLPGADCWGWATWSRGWSNFNSNGQFLLDQLNRRKMSRAFDFNRSYPFSKMLKEQIEGINDSWAVRWYASAFLAGKLTLYPGRSLVHNIGNDNSGTHCTESIGFDARLSETPIDLENIVVEISHQSRLAFVTFFKDSKVGLLRKLMRKFRVLLKSKTI
ncbi:MAG: glycosyltransferase [Candidatus Heimdallarchaeota archaeon]|nr:glycosyltransferase [Candidatus Heimdallarchaeota archaeon]